MNLMDTRDEDEVLEAVFDRQREIDDLAEGIAVNLYRARAIWIGGLCLPWYMLTEGQRRGYIDEARGYITKGRGE